MIPASFQANYPNLALALDAMKASASGEAISAVRDDAALQTELVSANQGAVPLRPVVDGLFEGPPAPNAAFMAFSMAAYRQLGVSDDVRVFVGRLWAEVVDSWHSDERRAFLQLMVRDPHDVFQALDFAVELFRRVQFTADEVLSWVVEARHRVGNDLIQHGFWGCAEAFCETSTTEAVVLVDKWLSLAPDAPSLWAIGNMIGWLRRSIGPGHPAFSAFSLLEARVQAPGYAAWRALYIQSWVHAGGTPLLKEEKVLELNRQFVQPGSEEEVAWCFLLKGIVTTDRHAWRWAHRELSRIACPTLTDRAKHWIVDATLHGAEFGTSVDDVPAGQWGDVLRALLPIAATSVGTWRRIHHSLVTLAGNNAVVMRGLIKTIANSSGSTWIELLRQSGPDPVWWTSSERRIRCPEWDHGRWGDAPGDSSLRSSSSAQCGWYWMRARPSAPSRASSI